MSEGSVRAKVDTHEPGKSGAPGLPHASPEYLMVLDCLGFGAMMENLSPAEADNRMQEWIRLLESSAAAAGIAPDQMQLLSDTAFVRADSSEAGLESLVLLARLVLNGGVPQSLPVRGAIVHGSFVWGRLSYGSAIVAAHKLEQNQEWIGVACDLSLPHADALYRDTCLAVYTVPMKAGPWHCRAAVVWEPPRATPLLQRLSDRGLAKPGNVATNVINKVTNTAMFGLYLDLLRRHGVAWSSFYGNMPIDVIELPILGDPK